jgi:hypothetical protein
VTQSVTDAWWRFRWEQSPRGKNNSRVVHSSKEPSYMLQPPAGTR